MDVFCDQAWYLRTWISHDVQEGENIGTASEILEDLDFALDFLLLDWFEHLYYTRLVGDDVDALEHLHSKRVRLKLPSCLEAQCGGRARGLTSEYFPLPTLRTIS